VLPLFDEHAAPEVAATERRVDPALEDAAREAERAAWRAFVPRAVALEATVDGPSTEGDAANGAGSTAHPHRSPRRTPA
jgi:hypothetical protein